MMMWEDPIVKAVRETRDQIAAAHGYDIHAIGRYYQQKQAQSPQVRVKRPPRRPELPNVASG